MSSSNRIKRLAARLPEAWKTVMACVPVVAMVGQEVVEAFSAAGADGTLSVEDGYKIVAAAIGAFLVYKKTNADAEPAPPGD